MPGAPVRLCGHYLRIRAEQQSVAAKSADSWTKLRDLLFDRQLAVFNSKARELALLCGRRSGKTRLIAIMLLTSACANPGLEMSIYVMLTAHHAARNLERWLDYFIAKFDLPIKSRIHKGQFYYEHANGHVIWLTGAKDHAEADKLRGDAYRLVIVDEAGSLRFASVNAAMTGETRKTLLQYICNDCVGPALSDLKGKLIVSGTPGIMPAGFFWEVSTGEGELPQWETHDWTVLDNPHHNFSPLAADYDPMGLRKEALKNGCTLFSEEEMRDHRERGIAPPYGAQLEWLKDATASFLREWLRHWARDAEAMCYPYRSSRNSFRGDLPQGKWRWVLGVDLGFRDHTTFIVTASRSNFAEVYYRKAYGKPEMTPDGIAVEIKRLMRDFPLDRIVLDEGAQGLMIAEGIRQKHGLPIEKADKRGKGGAIRAVADGLRAGTVLVDPVECAELVYEWQTVTWNTERTDHDDACVQDCSDAALYAYREHPNWEKWEHEPPTPGTPAAINAEMAAYKAKIAKQQSIVHGNMRPSEKRRALRGMRRR